MVLQVQLDYVWNAQTFVRTPYKKTTVQTFLIFFIWSSYKCFYNAHIIESHAKTILPPHMILLLNVGSLFLYLSLSVFLWMFNECVPVYCMRSFMSFIFLQQHKQKIMMQNVVCAMHTEVHIHWTSKGRQKDIDREKEGLSIVYSGVVR